MFINDFIKKIAILLVCFAVINLIPLKGQGSIIDDLNIQIKEQESKRAELERKAQEYQKVIDSKRTEIRSLNNEIAIFDAQISKLEIEINLTEEDIRQTLLEILGLEYGLEQTENDIQKSKISLAEIIRTIDQYDQATELEIVLSSDNLSDFFSQITYTESLQGQVQDTVNNLKGLKIKLESDKESELQKKESLESLKTELEKQQNNINFQKGSRRDLVNRTKGEEKQYQNLLSEIEAQKKTILGDINRLREQKSVELARIQAQQETPLADYQASLSWYYRQDDPNWANTGIGRTNSSMSNYGCAISSVAMVFTYHGSSITPGQLAKEPIFYYDLIVWPQQWNNIQLNTLTYRTAVDWFRIDRELGAGNPVIVRIQANGRDGGHYVVVHHKTDDGRYVVHDPLFGPNIFLSTSQAYIGSLYGTTTSINQMIIYH